MTWCNVWAIIIIIYDLPSSYVFFKITWSSTKKYPSSTVAAATGGCGFRLRLPEDADALLASHDKLRSTLNFVVVVFTGILFPLRRRMTGLTIRELNILGITFIPTGISFLACPAWWMPRLKRFINCETQTTSLRYLVLLFIKVVR